MYFDDGSDPYKEEEERIKIFFQEYKRSSAGGTATSTGMITVFLLLPYCFVFNLY